MYTRTLSRDAPPSASHTGMPWRLPNISHSAISIALAARHLGARAVEPDIRIQQDIGYALYGPRIPAEQPGRYIVVYDALNRRGSAPGLAESDNALCGLEFDPEYVGAVFYPDGLDFFDFSPCARSNRNKICPYFMINQYQLQYPSRAGRKFAYLCISRSGQGKDKCTKLNTEVLLMKEKKGFGDQLEAFFEGKGFYIVLFLCAAVIGVSAWTLVAGTDVETRINDIEAAGIVVTPGAAASAAPIPSATPRPEPVQTPCTGNHSGRRRRGRQRRGLERRAGVRSVRMAGERRDSYALTPSTALSMTQPWRTGAPTAVSTSRRQ